MSSDGKLRPGGGGSGVQRLAERKGFPGGRSLGGVGWSQAHEELKIVSLHSFVSLAHTRIECYSFRDLSAFP